MSSFELESVGTAFDPVLLQEARDRTLAVIEMAAQQIKPGMSEDEGRALIKELLKSQGAEKIWHNSQIRFGKNTLCYFGEKSKEENPRLQDDDVFFLDLGPVFKGHEGDVGRTYAVGQDAEMQKIARDAKTLWHKVRDHWASTQSTGAELYAYAQKEAESLGWILSLYEANGHRIADFPHAAHDRGTVEGVTSKPAAMRWILEIHLKHPSRNFGAFYEDLLD